MSGRAARWVTVVIPFDSGVRYTMRYRRALRKAPVCRSDVEWEVLRTFPDREIAEITWPAIRRRSRKVHRAYRRATIRRGVKP